MYATNEMDKSLLLWLLLLLLHLSNTVKNRQNKTLCCLVCEHKLHVTSCSNSFVLNNILCKVTIIIHGAFVKADTGINCTVFPQWLSCTDFLNQ